MADKPELSFNWSTPVKIPEGDPPISHDDTTPEVSEQARAKGWTSDYYNFGKAEGKADWFNPSMVQRSDGLWLLVRGSEPHPQGFQFGQNDIWAFKMDSDGITPTKGQRLKWLNKEPSQHFEDPRGFYHPKLNQTIIAVCTFCWYPNQPWTGAHQLIGSFNSDWECRGMKYPTIGGAPGQMQKIDKHENYQKNWSPFLHDDKLHILYKSKPWMIYAFRDTWSDFEVYTHEAGVQWQWGDIRGGTPPVRVGDYYFTFHHSSLPWRGRYRRYYAGCIAFEAKPPFRPKLMTPEPMLQGSQNSVWSQRKPLVVFPCGSIFKNGEWLISMGINDLKSAWVKCSHDSILALMKPIGQSDPVFFTATGLSDGERQSEQRKVGDENERRTREAVGETSSEDGGIGRSDYGTETSTGKDQTGIRENSKPIEQILSGGWGGASSDQGRLQPNTENKADTLPAQTTLEKRRAALVKARAARAANRVNYEMECAAFRSGKLGGEPVYDPPKPKKRRRKRRKRATKEDKLKALAEHESKKSLQSV